MPPRFFGIYACVLICLLFSPAAGARQVSLDGGISEIRAGDSLRGLATLNEVLKQTPNSPQLALIHAYRALAYAQMNQPERARAAAALALQANPKLEVGPPDFPAEVIAIFDRLRSSAPATPEDAAVAAETSGRYQDAFNGYLAAYRALPDPAPAADEHRLREHIAVTSSKLTTPPAIPADARAHVTKAQSLLDADALLGKSSGNAAAQAAAGELRQAVRLAPWWGEAAFKLATQLQKLQMVEEALFNVSIYKLADPKGYAASIEAATPKPAAAPAAPAARAATGNADVYIYWPPQVRGGGRPKVYCDGFRVADLNDHHYVRLSVPSGMHTMKFQRDSLPVAFEPGQTYYLRAAAVGFPVHAELKMVTPDEGAAEIKAKNIVPNDAKKTYSSGCSAPPKKR